MRNSLKGIITVSSPIVTESIFDKRPEQLSVNEFVTLTNLIEPYIQSQH